MADLSDSLVMQFSADISAVEKQMARLNKLVDGSATGAEKTFKRLPKAFEGEGNKMLGMARSQVQELEHVFRSSFDALSSGASPMRVLAQEGGRVAEVLANGGLGGVLKGLLGMFPPVVLGVAGMGAALYAAASAAEAFNSEQRQTVIALMGTAAASGLNGESIERLVNATDKLNHLSEQTTRSVALLFANHGVEGFDNIKQATAITEDLAASMGVKAPKAAELLATALRSPGEGVKQLNEIFEGFVSGPQMRMIENFAATGREAEAQSEILRLLQDRVSGNADEMSALAKMTRDVGNAFSDASHNVGEFFAKLAGFHGVDELPELKNRYAAAVARQGNPGFQSDGAGSASGDDPAKLKAEINRLEGEAAKMSARSKTATTNLDSQRLQEVKDRADPQRARIEQLQSDVKRLQKALADDQKSGAPASQIAEDKQYITGAETNLARAQRRETHMPGARTPRQKAPPEDRTSEYNSQATEAEDTANKALAEALKGLTTDIMRRATFEKQAIDAEVADNAAKTKADVDRINALKAGTDSNRQSQIAELEAAQATRARTAIIRKAAIDDETARQRREANEELADQVAKERVASIKAQLTPQSDRSQRRTVDLQSLDADKALIDAKREQARQAALRTDPSNADYINRQYDQKKSYDDANYAAGVRNINQQTASPMQQWAQEGAKDAQQVGDALENLAVKGMDQFNSALANSIVNSKNFGQAFSSVVKQLESDLIQLILKQGEVGLFGGGTTTPTGTNGGLLGSLFSLIPHFADGTSNAPGGLSLVGERGPELVNLPGGSQVTPNGVLRNLAGRADTRASAGITVQGPQFNLKGAVVTQDLIDQMTMISAQHAQQAAVAGAAGGHRMTMQTLQSQSRYRMR